MESKVKAEKQSQVRITVIVSNEELAAHEGHALKELAAKTKLPGFRPGKVPLEKIRAHYGPEGIRAQTIDHALPEIYQQVVVEHKLRPVAHPATTLSKLDPLTIEFVVDVFPTVVVKKPEKLRIEVQETKVEEKEIDEVVQEVQQRFRTFSAVDRPTATGDRVELNFTGEVDGTIHPRLASQHHPVILGSQTFLPGFEEQLVGMKVGETRDVTATFPEDHRAVELRGKPAVFHVTVEQVEEVQLPPIDDALAAKATGKEGTTLEAFRAEIRDGIKERKEHAEQDRQERALLEALVAATKVDLPVSFVEGELDDMIRELSERVQQQGLQLEQYLEFQRQTIEKLREQYRPEAVKRVTARLAIHQLAETENVEIPDTELDAALAALDDSGRARDPKFREHMRQNLRLSKTLSTLRARATGR